METGKFLLVRVDGGLSPETYSAAWSQALEMNPLPDGIVTAAFPTALFADKLKQANDFGIPVIDHSSGNPVSDGYISSAIPVEDNEARGRLQADWMLVDTKGEPNAIYVTIPDFTVLVAQEAAYTDQFTSNCPDCTTDTLNFGVNDIGTNIPGAVVSYLQTHPKVNYVGVAFDDLLQGLPQALKTAGLDAQVKIVGNNGSDVGLAAVASGDMVATIPNGFGYMGYKILDQFARQFQGGPLLPDSNLPTWIQTKDSVDPANPWLGPKGYPASFEKLWKLN